jgi:3-phenylpropionate/cinnamic acid dioxygenase small subunit
MSEPSSAESAQWAELAKRLAHLEDERAIVATLYAYGEALDYGDRRLFLDCFTENAEYAVEMRLGPEANFSYHGHGELTTYFDGHTHAPGAYHKHLTVNPAIVSQGDTATATSYFLRVDAAPQPDPATVLASGRYLDNLVRGPGRRWRIQSRRCEVENL